MVIRGDLEGSDVFLFAENTLYESIAEKGPSTIEVLYDFIVRVFKLEI